MQRNLLVFIACCVLGMVARGARATDNGAFVDEQLGKIRAAEKVRHQIVSVGDAVFVAERQAIEALGDRGAAVEGDAGLRKVYEEKVIPELIGCLGEESTRMAATGALEKIGAASVGPMLEALGHEADAEVRGGVVQALGEFRPRAREAVPGLIAALHDESAAVRVRAGYALCDFALEDAEARGPLIAALGDEEVQEGVLDFAESDRVEVEREAPEILRAIEARREADPVRRVAGWLYHGFLGVAVGSLMAFAYGMVFRGRGAGRVDATAGEMIPGGGMSRRGRVKRQRKLFAWTRGISGSYGESMDISDLIEGLRVGDSRCVDFALRGVALLCFGLSTFMAIGFGLVFYGQSGGWLFVGFVVVFMGVMVQQTRLSYRRRRARMKGGGGRADEGS